MTRYGARERGAHLGSPSRAAPSTIQRHQKLGQGQRPRFGRSRGDAIPSTATAELPALRSLMLPAPVAQFEPHELASAHW
jgi:hypothetical protein